MSKKFSLEVIMDAMEFSWVVSAAESSINYIDTELERKKFRDWCDTDAGIRFFKSFIKKI